VRSPRREEGSKVSVWAIVTVVWMILATAMIAMGENTAAIVGGLFAIATALLSLGE